MTSTMTPELKAILSEFYGPIVESSLDDYGDYEYTFKSTFTTSFGFVLKGVFGGSIESANKFALNMATWDDLVSIE